MTWDDQKNINAFSKLSVRLERLEDRFQQKKQEKEYLDDLTTELELADEEELIKYKVGDAFVSISLEETQERLTVEDSRIKQELEDLSGQLEKVTADMAKLKTLLYAKFGKSINLEK